MKYGVILFASKVVCHILEVFPGMCLASAASGGVCALS